MRSQKAAQKRNTEHLAAPGFSGTPAYIHRFSPKSVAVRPGQFFKSIKGHKAEITEILMQSPPIAILRDETGERFDSHLTWRDQAWRLNSGYELVG